MVEYFHDFRELHRNHKNFCHENFLAPPLSTGVHTSKSRNSDESQKSAKITKIFNHENLELYGSYRFPERRAFKVSMVPTWQLALVYL